MFAVPMNMPRRERRQIEGQAGPLPEIRLQGPSVVFYLDIALARRTRRLVLRCDPDGQVWASLDRAAGEVANSEVIPPLSE